LFPGDMKEARSVRRSVLRVLSTARIAGLADQFQLFLRSGERRVSKPNEKAAGRGRLAH
jgi:hypothetical protein